MKKLGFLFGILFFLSVAVSPVMAVNTTDDVQTAVVQDEKKAEKKETKEKKSNCESKCGDKKKAEKKDGDA